MAPSQRRRRFVCANCKAYIPALNGGDTAGDAALHRCAKCQQERSGVAPPVAAPGWFSRALDLLRGGRLPSWLAGLMLLGEFALSLLIVHRVPYTEIDWEAYMEEVAGVFRFGELDYANLRGGTGPLVYPAGFVYVYGLFWALTNDGANIRLAQYIFCFLSVLMQAAVLWVYTAAMGEGATDQAARKSSADKKGHGNTPWFPVWALGVLFLSRRIHSIFVLRLFNDCIAMLLAYFAIGLIARRHFRMGCLMFSLGVSIKMNVLLMAPALLLIMLKELSIGQTIANLFICASSQLLLGAPFLLTYPKNYLLKAFEFSRVFKYYWTVNWKFIPEEIFLSRPWAIILLGLHLFCLALFLALWHRRTQSPVRHAAGDTAHAQKLQYLTPREIIFLMFATNFAGICFSRTLHFQFYVWYFHMLPFLLWHAEWIPVLAKLIILVGIEWVWNIFPSNAAGSAVLFACHFALLAALLVTEVRGSALSRAAEKNE